MVIFAHGLFADDSASNEYVEVSSEGAAIRVETAGQTAFNVFAPMRDDSFVTNVFVSPVNDWTLAEPEESELPFEMGGGDSDSYTVEKSPEDSDVSGTIYFHNYWIKSNQADDAKVITVPFGTRVTYTSRKNNSSCSSDWMVNGSVVQDSSMIVFNRSWWNIVDWFYPSLETPRTGVYRIHANDVEYRDQLYDSGRMTIVSAKRISGPNSKASERVEAPAQESSWHETEVVYAQPCSAFDLTLNLEPAISVDQIDLIKPSISWTSEEGTTTYDANNPLSAHHVASRWSILHYGIVRRFPARHSCEGGRPEGS